MNELAMTAARTGVTALAVITPHWRSMVDASRLDMAKGDLCIFGQMFGDFYASFETLRDHFGTGFITDPWKWTIRHGFMTDILSPYSFADLDEAWQAILAEVTS